MMVNGHLILLALLCVTATCGQDSAKKDVPLSCSSLSKERQPLPRKPFKFEPGESYKHSPIIKFQINRDGTVSKAELVRDSGVRDIDKKLMDAVSGWKYKPHPECGIVENEMTVVIDWR